MRADREDKTCGDCGVKPGEFHVPGCDVERCPLCGGQMISCGGDCEPDKHLTDADLMPWTGVWPGEKECIEFGWFSKWGYSGWERCSGDDPEAGPDLNRLFTDAYWDKEAKRWRKR